AVEVNVCGSLPATRKTSWTLPGLTTSVEGLNWSASLPCTWTTWTSGATFVVGVLDPGPRVPGPDRLSAVEVQPAVSAMANRASGTETVDRQALTSCTVPQLPRVRGRFLVPPLKCRAGYVCSAAFARTVYIGPALGRIFGICRQGHVMLLRCPDSDGR